MTTGYNPVPQKGELPPEMWKHRCPISIWPGTRMLCTASVSTPLHRYHVLHPCVWQESLPVPDKYSRRVCAHETPKILRREMHRPMHVLVITVHAWASTKLVLTRATVILAIDASAWMATTEIHMSKMGAKVNSILIYTCTLLSSQHRSCIIILWNSLALITLQRGCRYRRVQSHTATLQRKNMQ